MKAIKAFFLVLLCLIPALFTGCGKTNNPKAGVAKVYYTYFDTVTTIRDESDDSPEEFDRRSAEAAKILETYHKLFDIYHEYSGIHNLATLNKQAGGEAMEADPALIEFLLYAKDLYEKTDGEMNVMMGSVLSIWHDLRTAASEDPKNARLPTEEELSEAAKHISIDTLEIDEEAGTVRISDPEASIDVGALGKGYATEKAAQFLESDGARGYVLSVGGNIRIIGTKMDGSGFVTGVRSPDSSDPNFAATLRLSDTACVTSGVYERFYSVKGKQYHHIIDKDTLYPARYFDSLTIVTRDSGLADALSTALFCMTYEDGLKLLSDIGGVEAFWIFPDGTKKYTPGLEKSIISTD